MGDKKKKKKKLPKFQIEMFSLENSNDYTMFVLRSTTDVERIIKWRS